MLIFQVAIVANARRNAEEHSRRQVNTSQTNSESNPSVDRTFFLLFKHFICIFLVTHNSFIAFVASSLNHC